MQTSQLPTKISTPFADGANAQYRRAIPIPSQINVLPGAASFTDGFPPLCFIPTTANGVPPFGVDFNGLMNQVTGWNRWQAAGGTVRFDSTFAGLIGGYPIGAVLQSTTAGRLWLNTVENNSTDPDGNSAANWVAVGGSGSASGLGLTATGLVPSFGSGIITVSAGSCADSTSISGIRFGATQTLQPSSSNVSAFGGYQGASAYPSSSTVHAFAAWGGTANGIFTSASVAPSSLPSSCTYYRRIFSFRTDGSGNPVPYVATESEGGALICQINPLPSLPDVNGFPINAGRALMTVGVPSGVPMAWQGNACITGSNNPSSNTVFKICSPFEPYVNPQNAFTTGAISGQPSGVPIGDVFVGPGGGNAGVEVIERRRITNTSAQLAFDVGVSSGVIGLYLLTTAFTDFRRS